MRWIREILIWLSKCKAVIQSSFRMKSIQFIIAVSFILTIFLMLFSSFVIYNKFTQTAEQNASLSNQQIVEQVAYNLGNYLNNMTNIFNLTVNSISESKGVIDQKLEDKMNTILLTRGDLVSIDFFTDQGSRVLGVPALEMRENTRIEKQEWFKLASNNPGHLFISAPHVQNLFMGQYKWVVSMSKGVTIEVNHYKVSGVLVIDINFKTIDNLCQSVSLGKKGYAYIIDASDGKLVYHPQQQLVNTGLKDEPIKHALQLDSGSYTDTVDGKQRLITVLTMSNVVWKVIGVSYLDEILASESDINHFILWTVAIVLLFMMLISIYMYLKISLPLKRLGKSMEQIEKGNFDHLIDVKGVGIAEVEQVSNQFNHMVVRIRQLMQQIIQEQEAKRKSEFEVLQSQIKPHFLYNTLNSVVRMIGIGKIEDVITTISSLSKLFRISLSKGKSVITIQEELEHVKHYLIIQQMRFKDKFDYEIIAEEEVIYFHTLKLILQPIVENSLHHGIEKMVDQGHILIKVWRENGHLLFQVIDNGLGMSKDTLKQIREGNVNSKQGSGVGVRNVHERIQLYYGEQYGIQIDSEVEEGTTVTITIPIVEEAAI
jgi:two-component system, sensor histidine kinase YesM